MPCRADYMEPNKRELELSKIFTIIDELDGYPFDYNNFSGYHPKAYGKNFSQADLDIETSNLCWRLKELGNVNILKLTLESQIWWRDHQMVDLRRSNEKHS